MFKSVHCFPIFCLHVCGSSSKVEMGKWIEDLNIAIDMAKKSQEKSSIFLDAGLGDHSNRKNFYWPQYYVKTYGNYGTLSGVCLYVEFFFMLSAAEEET